ncbi:MAG: hypothetical protein ABJC04_00435 [Verrucomicrobiota bacterium]
MKNFSLLTKLLFLAALIALIVLFARNRSAIAKATVENETLSTATLEAKRFAVENQEILRLKELNVEADKLRDANRELPKLRNEIRLLRDRAKEWKTVNEENERLKNAKINSVSSGTAPARPAGFLDKSELRDVGLNSPEATVQTYFWAMTQGNIPRLYECSERKRAVFVSPDGVPFTHRGEITPEEAEKTRKEVIKEIKNFHGYGISEKKTISDDVVEVGLQSVNGGGVMKMTLKRIDGVWKVKQ